MRRLGCLRPKDMPYGEDHQTCIQITSKFIHIIFFGYGIYYYKTKKITEDR